MFKDRGQWGKSKIHVHFSFFFWQGVVGDVHTYAYIYI